MYGVTLYCSSNVDALLTKNLTKNTSVVVWFAVLHDIVVGDEYSDLSKALKTAACRKQNKNNLNIYLVNTCVSALALFYTLQY